MPAPRCKVAVKQDYSTDTEVCDIVAYIFATSSVITVAEANTDKNDISTADITRVNVMVNIVLAFSVLNQSH